MREKLQGKIIVAYTSYNAKTHWMKLTCLQVRHFNAGLQQCLLKHPKTLRAYTLQIKSRLSVGHIIKVITLKKLDIYGSWSISFEQQCCQAIIEYLLAWQAYETFCMKLQILQKLQILIGRVQKSTPSHCILKGHRVVHMNKYFIFSALWHICLIKNCHQQCPEKHPFTFIHLS